MGSHWLFYPIKVHIRPPMVKETFLLELAQWHRNSDRFNCQNFLKWVVIRFSSSSVLQEVSSYVAQCHLFSESVFDCHASVVSLRKSFLQAASECTSIDTYYPGFVFSKFAKCPCTPIIALDPIFISSITSVQKYTRALLSTSSRTIISKQLHHLVYTLIHIPHALPLDL